MYEIEKQGNIRGNEQMWHSQLQPFLSGSEKYEKSTVSISTIFTWV